MKIWFVVLKVKENKQITYVSYVHQAPTEDIARDMCVRALLADYPALSTPSVEVFMAYEMDLLEPLRLASTL